MTWWNVATVEKKSVEEHELWQKGDLVIRRITGWRFGAWAVETEDDIPPVLAQLDGPNGDAINMHDIEYEGELESLDDGWYSDIIWPDDMEDTERDRLQEMQDEDSYAWEGDGWSNYETEVWFSGPLEITKD